MIVFQENLELVQEAGKRLHKLEQQRVQSAGTEEAATAAITMAAEKNKHTPALISTAQWPPDAKKTREQYLRMLSSV